MASDWVLVTGANGFIGARLVRELVARGEKVKAFVRPGANLSQLEDLPRDQVRIACGEITITDRVYAALRGCNRMFHVAAQFSIDERKRNEVLSASEQGARATLEAARRSDLDKIVVTSSVATLGASSSEEPMDESASFSLDNPNSYSEAKLRGERVAMEYAARGLPITVVNPGLVLGPGDYKPTPAGAQVVSYLSLSPSLKMPIVPGGFSIVDVDDVAAGHIAAMDQGRVGERYILGGQNLSNEALYRTLADVTGLAEPGQELTLGKANMIASFEELRSWWSGQPPLITRKLLSDFYGQFVFVSSDKAKKELGYSFRPAREAIARACHWYLDHGYVEARAARRARLELAST